MTAGAGKALLTISSEVLCVRLKSASRAWTFNSIRDTLPWQQESRLKAEIHLDAGAHPEERTALGCVHTLCLSSGAIQHYEVVNGTTVANKVEPDAVNEQARQTSAYNSTFMLPIIQCLGPHLPHHWDASSCLRATFE